MLKRRGMALKTFIFTSILIVTLLVASFAALYFALPDYYMYSKNKTLQVNIESLVARLEEEQGFDEYGQAITQFARENNAEVLAFDSDNVFVPELSSPFTMFSDKESGYTISISVRESGVLPEDAGDEVLQGDTDNGENHDGLYIKQNKVYFTQEGGGQGVAGTADKTGVMIAIADKSSVSTSLDVKGNDIISGITVMATLQPIDEAKGVLLDLLPYVLLIGVAVTLVAAYFYTKTLTQPILKISAAAREMQGLAPQVELDTGRGDEIGQLSRDIEALYKNLRSKIEELHREMDRAAALEKSKADFMRAASHELKTPVTALGGVLEGMMDNVGAFRDRDKYLAECKAQTDRLSKLVEEILAASSLDTVEASAPEPTDISELVREVAEGYRLFIEQKRLDLSVDMCGYVVTTDRALLLRAVSNLVSNAVKYTGDGGGIDISLIREQGKHLLRVKNSCGREIPARELERLCEPFYTLDYSRDKTRSGTGLGLYIVRRNLEMLGLSYNIQSVGDDFIFTIYFPDN